MSTSVKVSAVSLILDRADRRLFRAITPARMAWLHSPRALLRLAGLTAPLVITALVLLARRPVVAAALLTAATWI